MKKPQSKAKAMEQEWRDHNKWLKQRHLRKVSFQEFIDNKTAKKLRIADSFDQPPEPARPSYRRSTPEYPSRDTGVGVAAAAEPKVYSGERKLLGIATLHKSNMVPIFDPEHAKDVARMRR